MNRFELTPCDQISRQEIKAIGHRMKQVENTIEGILAPSRERSLALTNLEEAFMWALRASRADQLKREDGTLPLPMQEETKVDNSSGQGRMGPPPDAFVDTKLLIKDWEVIGLPRRIGGIMAVEVREKN